MTPEDQAKPARILLPCDLCRTGMVRSRSPGITAAILSLIAGVIFASPIIL